MIEGWERGAIKRQAGIPSRKFDARRSDEAIDNDGKRGEDYVARLLGVASDSSLFLGGDPGYDLIWRGMTIAVRSTHYDNGHLLFTTAEEFRAHRAVLVVLVDDLVCRIGGWIPREWFFAFYVIRDFGYGSRACMPQAALLPWDWWDRPGYD